MSPYQFVYEDLPCDGGVDLDHCTVLPLAMLCNDAEVNSGEILDRVIEAGSVYLPVDGEIQIQWGKTSMIDGYYIVVVDAETITMPILRALWRRGVIDGEFPAYPNQGGRGRCGSNRYRSCSSQA